MADLDTCFFCARTGDVTLDEYDVVPEVTEPTTAEQRTLMLCGTCASKLDLVLETVLGTIDGVKSSSVSSISGEFDARSETSEQHRPSRTESRESSTAGGGAADGDDGVLDVSAAAGDEGRSGPDATESEPDPIFGAGNDDAAASSDGGTSAGTQAERSATAETGAPEESPPARDGSGGAGGDSGVARDGTDDADTSTGPESVGSGAEDEGLEGISFAEQPDKTQQSDTAGEIELETGQGESAGETATDDTPQSSTVDQTDVDGASATDSGASTDVGESMDAGASADAGESMNAGASADAGESTDAGEATDTGASADAGESDADVDVKTYKRVIRLLRNRELPIDRAEFESLAASAYDIDQAECAAALDAAVERDLLVESDGRIDRT